MMNVVGGQGYVFSLPDRVAARWESQPPHAPFPCLLSDRLHPSSAGPWTKLDLSVMEGALVCVPRFEGWLFMGQVGGGVALPPWGWNWVGPCMIEKQAVGNCSPSEGPASQAGDQGCCLLMGLLPSVLSPCRSVSTELPAWQGLLD